MQFDGLPMRSSPGHQADSLHQSDIMNAGVDFPDISGPVR